MLNNNKKQETLFFGTKCGNANSIAAGYATETTNYGEIATGILNKSTKGDNPNSPEGVVGDPKATLFSVGCGTKEERKNALEVKGDGSVIISGKDGSDINLAEKLDLPSVDLSEYVKSNEIYQCIKKEYDSSKRGANCIAIDDSAQAIGDSAIAIGNNAKSTNDYTIAVGSDAQAPGDNGTAIGNNAQADGSNATALGTGAQATGDGSVALGVDAQVTGEYSTALGNSAQTTGNKSIALGFNAQTTKANATALGTGAQATGEISIALGSNASATNTGSIALGRNTIAVNSYAIALGCSARTGGENSIALGYGATTRRDYAVAIGKNYMSNKSIFSVGFDGVNGIDMDADNYGLYLKGLGGYTGKNLTKANNLNPDIKSVQQIINSKADLTPIVTSTNATISLQPNKKYEITAGNTLVLTFTEPSDKTHKNEYLFSINTGSSVSTITFPTDIIWDVEPVIAANKHYEINVQYSQGKYWGTVRTWNIPR